MFPALKQNLSGQKYKAGVEEETLVPLRLVTQGRD
jgi:hypothetical protein